MENKIAIIGAGLAGLYSAWRLQQAGIDYQIIEARERLGGRIHSENVLNASSSLESFDLGPSWIWPSFQPNIDKLLNELNLPIFEQYTQGDLLYEQSQGAVMRSSDGSPMAGSYRIVGGTQALIQALAQSIDSKKIQLGQTVTQIKQDADGYIHIRIAGQSAASRFQQVFLALPQRLIARSIKFEPELPLELKNNFIQTATWMAGQAKIVAIYETAFWRENGLSGEAFSPRGPMTEIHDASPAQGGPYALFGFVGLAAQARQEMGQQQLLAMAQQQLERMFGAQAANPIKMVLKDWSSDPHTATIDDLQASSGHPIYGLSQSARAFGAGKISFVASEAASENGGYIEGALNAADQALKLILRH